MLVQRLVDFINNGAGSRFETGTLEHDELLMLLNELNNIDDFDIVKITKCGRHFATLEIHKNNVYLKLEVTRGAIRGDFTHARLLLIGEGVVDKSVS